MEADDHDDDADEEPVAEDTFKHVELVVEAAVVEDVEDLHPDEAVEDEGVELELYVRVGKVVAEDIATGKVEHEDDGDLVDVLTHDLLPHGDCDERTSTLGWAVENLFGRRVGGEGKGCKGIHNEVDPEELYGPEHRLHFVIVYGCDECEYNSGDVDSDLELFSLVL